MNLCQKLVGIKPKKFRVYKSDLPNELLQECPKFTKIKALSSDVYILYSIESTQLLLIIHQRIKLIILDKPVVNVYPFENPFDLNFFEVYTTAKLPIFLTEQGEFVSENLGYSSNEISELKLIKNFLVNQETRQETNQEEKKKETQPIIQVDRRDDCKYRDESNRNQTENSGKYNIFQKNSRDTKLRNRRICYQYLLENHIPSFEYFFEKEKNLGGSIFEKEYFI